MQTWRTLRFPTVFMVVLLLGAYVGAAPLTHEISLAEGWNLISLPLTPADRRLRSVLAPIWPKVRSVWAYDPGAATWQRHVGGAPGFLNTLAVIQPGRGYWLQLSAAATLTLTGEEAKGAGIYLHRGWNLVGFNDLVPHPVADDLASIAERHGAVWGYDRVTDQWQGYDPTAGGDGGALTHFEPGRGYWVEAHETLRWGGLPPDPAAVAPPLDPTVATRMADAVAFLYAGENPIQLGVAPGTIERQRTAVLRGKVLGPDGALLPGVRVTIADHPEYGYTLTRADGRFDLVVNGGGLLRVQYQRDGLLPVHRQTPTQWEDYTHLPDVVMTAPDPAVTPVDLAAPAPMQVARGSAVTDAEGSRRATLLLPQGTQAQMRLADGTTQPLAGLSLRATEYTVGATGHEAMPEVLPPTSGYTYCVEYSVDEAVAADAAGVEFSQPLVHYVENFLGFPVGGAVPVGYYDRAQGAWIPAENGRVIKVLSAAGGTVALDVDGSGTPAAAAALAALGITDAERVELARSTRLVPNSGACRSAISLPTTATGLTGRHPERPARKEIPTMNRRMTTARTIPARGRARSSNTRTRSWGSGCRSRAHPSRSTTAATACLTTSPATPSTYR
jgi:hypothetical protein